MKKTVISFLAAGALLAAGTISVFAAGDDASATDNAAGTPKYSETSAGVSDAAYQQLSLESSTSETVAAETETGVNYVDADGDGICDNYDGTSNGYGNGCGAGYVDADGDGVCDNYDGSSNGYGNGCGYGNGACSGNGSGAGYVDSDSNGVCDNYENRTCPQDGTGNQYGGHHGRNR